MKNLITLFAIALVLFACNKEVKKKSTSRPIQDIPLNERAIPVLPGLSTSNTVIGGAHYICPKNCIGGNGTSAGKCSVCETEMAHNQGFHTNQNTNSISVPTSPNIPASTTSDGPNANGQFHYTCSNGCTGGAGKAGNCSSCGNALEHNTAYHS